MKKILFVLFGLFAYPTSAQAVSVRPGEQELQCMPMGMCPNATTSMGCNVGSKYCDGCTGTNPTVISPEAGIIATTTSEKNLRCAGPLQICECALVTRFSCAEGYGGSCSDPTDKTTCNCVKCPDNSTCTDANNVACNDGYYLTQQVSITETTYKCNTCPENAVCTGNTIHCNPGYYKTGRGVGTIGAKYKCSSCPDGTTSPVSATSISQCYIPMGTNFEDLSGSGAYVADCYSE